MNSDFFTPMPKVVAHRGDSAHYPENTLLAFTSAVSMQVDVIETDVHLSKDGEVVIWHDPTLDRNTDGSGRIEDHTLAELKGYDAGYTFTLDEGKTFPFRGKNIQLCTLVEALDCCPDQRFNVDLKTKSPQIVKAFIDIVRSHNAYNRIVAASFHLSNLKLLRELDPMIQTSITTVEVLPLLARQKLHMLPKNLKTKVIFQVPVRQWGVEVVTPSFVKMMHDRDAIIQVWTINEEEEMERLYRMGVDSVMTDKPALAIKVAKRLGLRS